jgi:hypothetical protein
MFIRQNALCCHARTNDIKYRVLQTCRVSVYRTMLVILLIRKVLHSTELMSNNIFVEVLGNRTHISISLQFFHYSYRIHAHLVPTLKTFN